MNGGCQLAKGDLGASSSAARREKMRLLLIMRGWSHHSLSPWGLGSACQGIRSCSGFSVNDIGGWLVLPLSLRDQSTRINCAAADLVWAPPAEWGGQQSLICSNWVGQLYHLYFHHCICLQLVIICQPRFGKPRTGGLLKRLGRIRKRSAIVGCVLVRLPYPLANVKSGGYPVYMCP